MDYRPLKGEDIFKCMECGACCKGFGGTYISEEDIEKISKYINISLEIFLDKYCTMSGSKYVLAQGKDDNCIFYDKEKQCSIHPVKPYMCKAWPFIKTIISNPENWNAMAGSCPGMKKDIEHDILKKIVDSEIKLL
ncbi:MAG: YkgJ family cysteine cluster protein [Desulfobacteraceae bacterium]|nr:YkgJ family cysteine cluster protein [Desulfobacteraceae bacterium]